MSFSNYIKDTHIFENYRKSENVARENRLSTYEKSLKSANVYKDKKKKIKILNNRISTPNINDLEKRNKLLNFLNSSNHENENQGLKNNSYNYNIAYKRIIELLNIILIFETPLLNPPHKQIINLKIIINEQNFEIFKYYIMKFCLPYFL